MKKLVLLYEGDTELEFYRRLLQIVRVIKRKDFLFGKKNLRSSSGINHRVREQLSEVIYKNKDKNHSLVVLIVHDRDGGKEKESSLNLEKIRSEFQIDKNNVKHIMEIVATKHLESWFFYDLDGIYDFAGVPVKKRNYTKYSNPHSQGHSVVSAICRSNGKDYQKGKRASELIEKLNLEKIYNECQELKEGIDEVMKKL